MLGPQLWWPPVTNHAQAADARARGFLLGATAGRTTLNGEGLQHQELLGETCKQARVYHGVPMTYVCSVNQLIDQQLYYVFNHTHTSLYILCTWRYLLPSAKIRLIVGPCNPNRCRNVGHPTESASWDVMWVCYGTHSPQSWSGTWEYIMAIDNPRPWEESPSCGSVHWRTFFGMVTRSLASPFDVASTIVAIVD